jgi:hypothetical protein
MSGTDELVTVHLLQFPVTVAAQARQHFEELSREFSLIRAGAADEHARDVPRRLLDMVDTLTARFGGVTSDADVRVENAIDRGDEWIDDHVMTVPAAAGPASRALADMLEEADAYCLQGQYLLTLATPPELVVYRRWYLGEVMAQLAGATPTPWPQHRAHALGPA